MSFKKYLKIFIVAITAITYIPTTSAFAQVPSPYLQGVGYCHWVRDWSLNWAYTSSDPEVWWSTLEPRDDDFNIQPLISFIERQTNAIKGTNKQFWIQIYLSGLTRTGQKKYPQWLIDKGAKYVARGDDGTFVPWDSTFTSELQELLKKINEEFKKTWGGNFESMPENFGGIVVWSGGYYGEMQIYNEPQRPQWERIAKEYFASQGKNLEPPSKRLVSPNDPFVKEFNKLWFRSAVNLARIYASSFNPKIKLMVQLGNGLYGSYGGGFIEYEGKNNVQVDEAAAYEILKQPWGKNRFLFKFNGWQTRPQAVRRMMTTYQWIFKNLIARGALGVGFEGGHLSPNMSREEVEELVQVALGIDSGTPVDFVCIQPGFIGPFINNPDLMQYLSENLGKRTGVSPLLSEGPTITPSPSPEPLSVLKTMVKKDFLNRPTFLFLSLAYLAVLHFFFGTSRIHQTKRLVIIFLLSLLLAETFSSYTLGFILLFILSLI